jgi:hypothetical protein
LVRRDIVLLHKAIQELFCCTIISAMKSVELMAGNSSACEGIIAFDYLSYVQSSTGRVVKNFSCLSRKRQFFIIGYWQPMMSASPVAPSATAKIRMIARPKASPTTAPSTADPSAARRPPRLIFSEARLPI